MATEWVDFKSIKQNITMERVLIHYQVLGTLRQTPQGFRGPCPIHKGKHGSQFHVDVKKNRWNCFGGCDMTKFEGHVIGFVAAMENVSLRDAALLIAQWYKLDTAYPAKSQAGERAPRPQDTAPETLASSEAPEVSPPAAVAPDAPEGDAENRELDFELKSLSADHAFFRERGIGSETIATFGLGFCSRGIMKDRIVFPIHRRDGKLIGYTGRTVRKVTDDNPKWLLPPGLVKAKVLFNFHRVAGKFRRVIIVEGGTSLVAVHQAGFPNVVGLLGREILEDSSLSYDQFRLITDNFDEAVLLLDGDQDGLEAAQRAALKLVPRMFVRQIILPAELDPSSTPASDLARILSVLQ